MLAAGPGRFGSARRACGSAGRSATPESEPALRIGCLGRASGTVALWIEVPSGTLEAPPTAGAV
jgi:hypothetical protein